MIKSFDRLTDCACGSEDLSGDFRGRTQTYLGGLAILFLSPFSLNNFYQGKFCLGAFSLLIVTLLIVNAKVTRKNGSLPAGFAAVLSLCLPGFLFLCFNTRGPTAVFWCFPAMIAFYFLLPKRSAFLLNVVSLVVLVPQIWKQLAAEMALRATVNLMLVSLLSAIFIHLLEQQQQQLRELAVKDPLTGVMNRLLLDTFLERSALSCERLDRPASLVCLDLDHFKSINDRFGHEAGDRVLRGLGNLLLDRVRRTDAVFRLGGEEFLLLLPDTDSEAAASVAEELRLLIRQSPLLLESPVTASLGVASLSPDESWQSWLKRCDIAVYSAKRMGRDRVALAPPFREHPSIVKKQESIC